MKRLIERKTYHHYLANHRRWPFWRGLRTVKYATDMISYAEIIMANKPDLLIECGTRFGGSAMFFADIMETIPNGRVVTIDTRKVELPFHPRVLCVQGSSTSTRTLQQVRLMISGGCSVMVSLDSDHHRANVKRELYHYAPLVTKGQFLVVEDTFPPDTNWANEAVDWWVTTRQGRKFRSVAIGEKYLYTTNSWFRRT